MVALLHFSVAWDGTEPREGAGRGGGFASFSSALGWDRALEGAGAVVALLHFFGFLDGTEPREGASRGLTVALQHRQ